MSGLTFRKATAADLQFIVDLIVGDSVIPTGDDPGNVNDPRYLKALAAIDKDRNQELVIAELDGVPVGTIQLTVIPGIAGMGQFRLLVEQVHIQPKFRNRGFGAEMMQHAIARARARGCRTVQLTSSKARKDAHRFYERLGFKASHEGFKLYL